MFISARSLLVRYQRVSQPALPVLPTDVLEQTLLLVSLTFKSAMRISDGLRMNQLKIVVRRILKMVNFLRTARMGLRPRL